MATQLSFSKDKKIIIRTFSGNITFREIMQSWNHLIHNKIITPEHIGVINDFQDARLNINFENLEQLIGFFKTHSKIFSTLKLAVITKSTDDVVFPMYAGETNPDIKIKAFCTTKAAEEWIRN